MSAPENASHRPLPRMSALWPLPFCLFALGMAATAPSSRQTTTALIVVLNFGIVYFAVLAVVTMVGKWRRKSWSTVRCAALVTAIAVVYHIIAGVLPRPTSGWVRIGVGDLMLGGGALLYGAAEQATLPMRRGRLMDRAALERALTGEDKAPFRVIGAERTTDGWTVYGRLGEGPMAWHVASLQTPLTVTTTGFEQPLGNDAVLSGGALRTFGRDAMYTTRPGGPTSSIPFPPETKQWLETHFSRLVRFHRGEWLVAISDYRGAQVAVVDANGNAAPTKLELVDGDIAEVTRRGDKVYVLTEQNQGQRWRLQVVEGGQVLREESAQMTSSIEALDLGPPVRLAATTQDVWAIGFSAAHKKAVAAVLPDGQPFALEPGSVTAVIDGGDELLVGTTGALLRVTSSGAKPAGEGWVIDGTVTSNQGTPSAGLRPKQSRALTLTEFTESGPVPFLPNLKLLAD